MIPTTISPVLDEDQKSPKNQDGDSEDDTDDNEEGDDARAPKVLIGNYRPTQKETDEHMKTHLPFRPWCKYYVRGKSKSKAHNKQIGIEKDRYQMPIISVDFMYMNVNNDEKEKDEKDTNNPIMVVKERDPPGT